MDEQTGRALLERLDVMNAWLAQISGQLATQEEQQTAGYIEQAGKIQSLLDLFASLGLPSSPQYTTEVTVNAVTPTLLYRNDSLPFRRIRVTNDDPAQWIYLGKRNVNIQLGEILMGQTFIDYVLPQGDEMWAICMVATVSVRISEAYDLLGGTQIIASE